MIDFIDVGLNVFIEMLIAWQYFRSFYNAKCSKQLERIFMIGMYIVFFALFWLKIAWLNVINFCAINCFLCYYLFSRKKSQAFFHAVTLTGTMLITEVLVELYCMHFLGGFLSFMNNSFTYALVNFSSRLFYGLIIQMIILLFAKKKSLKENKKGFMLLLGMIPLVTIWMTFVIAFVCMDNHIGHTKNVLLFVSVILLLLVNFVAFWAYDSNQRFMQEYIMTQTKLREQQAEAEYYRKLAEQTEHQKILIHDMKNHLYTISGLSERGGETEIQEYIQQLLELPALKSSVTYCSQPVLNVILEQYREICEQKLIHFGVDIRKDSVDYIEIDDLTALFGNLLKNAVEAATGVTDAYVDVVANYNARTSQTFLSVENSVCRSPVFDDNGQLVSQKKDGYLHGMGMKSIQRVAERYHGSVSYHYDDKDRIFHTMVLLYNNCHQ